MPFCAVPKQLDILVKRERVVINEANVIEFGADAQLNAYSSASMPPQAAEKTKKPHHRLGHFINPSSSSRLSKSSSKSSSSQMQTFVPQDPILAQRSQSNPFVDNRFPVIIIQIIKKLVKIVKVIINSCFRCGHIQILTRCVRLLSCLKAYPTGKTNAI